MVCLSVYVWRPPSTKKLFRPATCPAFNRWTDHRQQDGSSDQASVQHLASEDRPPHEGPSDQSSDWLVASEHRLPQEGPSHQPLAQSHRLMKLPTMLTCLRTFWQYPFSTKKAFRCASFTKPSISGMSSSLPNVCLRAKFHGCNRRRFQNTTCKARDTNQQRKEWMLWLIKK